MIYISASCDRKVAVVIVKVKTTVLMGQATSLLQPPIHLIRAAVAAEPIRFHLTAPLPLLPPVTMKTLVPKFCADGQTSMFGYSKYDDTQSYSSFGIGVGVKRAITQKPILTAIFLLLI